ncbi:MAG: TfoX/Sxy family protein [Acidimicrobiia bacterium]|nr:TfoX/Sxy family protein [Acidimicrobiia bacterium]
MNIPKPSEADKDYFRSIVPEDPRVEVKPMFGNVAAFVNGNMFMGLFGPDVGVRLDENGRDELTAVEGTSPFGPDDRPMREYVTLPEAWRDDPKTTAEWADRALDHVASMPPKEPKKK